MQQSTQRYYKMKFDSDYIVGFVRIHASRLGVSLEARLVNETLSQFTASPSNIMMNSVSMIISFVLLQIDAIYSSLKSLVLDYPGIFQYQLRYVLQPSV